MAKTFGFIGTGNMGSALARAAAKTLDPVSIILHNRTMEKAKALAEELNCRYAMKDFIPQTSSYIFLGVKPQMMGDLLAEMAPILAARTSRFILVSMAAGLTMADIRTMAGGDYPIIRIMPNTPVAVGEGVILYDALDVTEEELNFFCKALSAAGLLDHLPEPLFDAGMAIAGCGPAFADLFMEALIRGGVANGLPKETAQAYAIRMMQGAAKLALETGKDPAELRKAVCSPGGTTLAGIDAMEQAGFSAAAEAAVHAAIQRSKELRK